MAHEKHNEIVHMLMEIGKKLGFDSTGRTMETFIN